MTEHIFNWFVDTMAHTETLDLHFVVTDLLDIPESIEEQSESASFDALAIQTVNEVTADRELALVPVGKQVL